VRRGLYGALVIEPADAAAPEVTDIVAAVHTLDGTQLMNATDGVERRAVTPGTPVRLRLINTDSAPQRFDVGGTPFRVVAIDGTDLVGPTQLSGRTLVLAAGGRYDVAFTMPNNPVKLVVEDTLVGLALSADGKADPPSPSPGPEFDPTTRLLEQLVASPQFAQESADTQDRVKETLRFMNALGAWSDEMLRLSPSTLEKVLKMGASVQKFVRGS